MGGEDDRGGRLGAHGEACRAPGLRRSSYYRFSGRGASGVALERRIVELSAKHPRYGYRRETALLRRDGQRINAKLVQRARRAEGLQVRER